MKRILSITLLLLLLINTIGVSTYFTVHQFLIKKEIKRKIKNAIPASELTVITANENDLDWEDEKEFHYQGNMYDVVRKKENKDGSTTFYCINDKDEKQLFANIGKMMQKQNKNETTLLKNILSCVWNINTEKEKNKLVIFIEKDNNFEYINSYKTAFSKSINQPPKLG